jgi:hypothetical protein
MRTVAVILGAGLVAASVAHGAVLCAAKKSGAVRLREACKPKENPIDATTLGLGGALGYAHVVLNGTTATVDVTRSKGLTDANITRVITGVVCFHDLSFTPKSAIANVDAATTNVIAVAAAALPPDSAVLGTCGGSAQAVVTTAVTTAANGDFSFYVVFN